ncbi:hypothetical protein BGX38DRAFT_1266887 [Terfezia claveryi]|nr:hypothetical protein BGX38DRAFT_1266887 [Terfezia claveryi]
MSTRTTSSPCLPCRQPKDIVLKEVKDFDRSPANLSLFNTQIRNALKKLDIPVYFGGSVIGSEEEGFTYVAAGTAGAKPNYKLGEDLCSGISNKFTGAAAQ